MAIETWGQLLQEIKDYRSTFPKVTEFWFRGQSNSSYVLLPSLLRNEKNKQKEKDLFYTYKRLSHKITLANKNE